MYGPPSPSELIARRLAPLVRVARFARNAFEAAIENMARRVIRTDDPDLKTLYFSDIPIFADLKTGKTRSSAKLLV